MEIILGYLAWFDTCYSGHESPALHSRTDWNERLELEMSSLAWGVVGSCGISDMYNFDCVLSHFKDCVYG